MNYVVAAALLLLALWFYLASGGGAFEPIAEAPPPAAPEPAPESAELVVTAAPAPPIQTDPEEVPAPVTLAPPPALDGTPGSAAAEAPPQPPEDGAVDAAVAAALESILAPQPEPGSDERTAPDASVPQYRYVSGTRVNMREGPATTFPVVTVALEGTPMEVLREENGWLELRDPEGRIGWMAATLLR